MPGLDPCVLCNMFQVSDVVVLLASLLLWSITCMLNWLDYSFAVALLSPLNLLIDVVLLGGTICVNLSCGLSRTSLQSSGLVSYGYTFGFQCIL